MGSGGSKGDCSGGASSSNGSLRKGKCKGSRVFQSSCLGASSRSRHYNNDDTTVSENGLKSNVAEMDSDQVKIECYRKVKVGQNDCISSSNDEWSEDNNVGSRTGSGSGTAVSAQSLSSPARLLSRFSFVPGNGSFRLSRANSLGSSRAYPVPSSSLRMFNDDKEDEDRVRPRSAGGVIDLNGTQQSDDLLSVSLSNRTAQCNDESSSNFRFHSHTSEFFGDVLDNGTVLSIHNAPRHEDGSLVGFNGQYRSPRVAASGSIEGRVSDRRTAGQEPSERNVRFSRTLSVGRLRDRVLHRSSLTDLNFCPMQQEREATDSSLGVGRQVFGGERRESESEGNTGNFQPTSGYPSSGMSSSLFSNQDHEVETSRSREARYHDLLEHRSNFLERRRRIRSQVRALQRLGNRFENLSGHERSCILSGQHRTGCCTCRVNNRNINSNDDTSARASISRIVMLAEALFEVLDEIHQQSAVLSSRPSVSSLGSVPAPNDVVDSLPIRLYTKSKKHHKEEAAQCYICLVEYEEGDSMRVLPCRHEFHRTCVDKWLKEIHRVCPLCRGDICRYDALPAENRGLSVNTFS